MARPRPGPLESGVCRQGGVATNAIDLAWASLMARRRFSLRARGAASPRFSVRALFSKSCQPDRTWDARRAAASRACAALPRSAFRCSSRVRFPTSDKPPDIETQACDGAGGHGTSSQPPALLERCVDRGALALEDGARWAPQRGRFCRAGPVHSWPSWLVERPTMSPARVCGAARAFQSARGRVKWKVLPLPISLVTEIFPLWVSMVRLAIASPSPVPSVRRLRRSSAR